ncbi:MAG: type I 3-dehydroquinate dehydratase, partial [Bacteroidales bacterium]|nr:type I 3-dehydroquinate dehydratase [Candidatus Egerieousia equi]
MICTSIQNRNFEQIKAILADPAIEMAEIRLDLCPIAVKDIKELFGNATKPLVATCRFSADNAWERLKAAVESGATFADLELFEDEGDKEAGLVEKEFTELCRKNGTRIIRSYHNFEGTPGLAALKKKVRQCFEAGADIAKIATTAKKFKDSCTIDSLYEWFNDEYAPEVANLDSMPGSCSKHIVPRKSSGAFKAELIAFAMGELGRVSRVDCLMNGAPFTYTSLNADECTAPGQLSVEEMNVLLYNKKSSTSLDSANASDAEGNSRNSLTKSEKAIVSMFSLENIVQQRNDNRKTLYLNRIYNTVPASKSYAQRAIIAAALAQGTSRIYNYTPCADSEAAIEAARALGATISKEYSPQKEVCTLVINGIEASEKTRLHIAELHTGESGLLTRLMVPLISLLNDCDCRITGERTLVGRPLKGLKETMALSGVKLTGAHEGQAICVPFTIKASDTNADIAVPAPVKIKVDGSNGSQIISGLMMALPMSGYDYEIIVENPKSIPYLRMTAQVLAGFGIQISILPESNATCYNNSSSAFEFSKETLKIDSIELSGSNTFSTAETMGTDSVIRIRIRGNQIYKAADYVLEGDWSGAANLLVAGAI